MPDETIKLKIEAPRIEIALGSISDSHPGPGPYVAVAMLHLPEGEAMYQPLVPKTAREGFPHLDTKAAADFLAEIYDFICERWGLRVAHQALAHTRPFRMRVLTISARRFSTFPAGAY